MTSLLVGLITKGENNCDNIIHKFIDLFCGIGGFRLALEKRGLSCVFSSEINSFAQEAYSQNFGEKPRGDITEIPANEIPKHDILCAGFPCQSFSLAGKKDGVMDARGRLFYEIHRISEYHKPYILLLENVKNILKIENGSVIQNIQAALNNIGYELHKHTLNASYFGIPQSRERVYFVGLRTNIKTNGRSMFKYRQPKETFEKIFLHNILEKKVDNGLIVNRNDIRINRSEEELANKLGTIKVGIIGKGRQGETIYSPKGHAITISSNGGGVGASTGLYNTQQGIRRLSIPECKKVMGFPVEHYVSKGTQGYKQLGNAVIPDMIGHVYDSIKIL